MSTMVGTMPRTMSPTMSRSMSRTVDRPAAPGVATVRLTRRGRLVVTLALTMLVLAAFLAMGGSSAATREAGDPRPTRTVEVQSGQTLWGIASELAEPGQIREMVYTIERLNSLPDATLTEGQVLAVPATAAG